MFGRVRDFVGRMRAIEEVASLRLPRRGHFLLEVAEGTPVVHPVTEGDVLAYQLDVGWVQEVAHEVEYPLGRLNAPHVVETRLSFAHSFVEARRPDVMLRSRDGMTILLPADTYALRDHAALEGRPLDGRHRLALRLPPHPRRLAAGYRSRTLIASQIVLVRATLHREGPANGGAGDGTRGSAYRVGGATSGLVLRTDAGVTDVLDLMGHPGFADAG